MVFPSSHVWMWKLDYKESWAPKNWYFWTVVLEKTLERVLWTAKRSHQSIPVLNIHWKDWCWSWSSNTFATWCEELTHWKRPWCWKILKSSGEGDKTGWCGWMASPTLWTWIWASSGSGDQQRSLACCSLWGRKESHTTEQLNWIDREYQAYGVGSLTFQLGDTYPVQVFWNSAGLIVLSFLSNYWNNLEKAQWRVNSNTLGTDRVVSPWWSLNTGNRHFGDVCSAHNASLPAPSSIPRIFPS